MGRSQEFLGRVRRAARATLDQASTAIDRVATVIRDRMARRGSGADAPPPSVETVAPARPVATPMAPDAAAPSADLADLTKAELYRMAQEHEIAGRSKLSKDELVEALQSEG